MTTRHAIVPLLLACTLALPAAAQAAGQPTFSSAEEAVQALIAAAKAGDSAKLVTLLGPGSEPLISSGDAVADKAEKTGFLAAYAEKNSLVPGDADSMILQTGADQWPLPIPIVKKNGRWFWDGAAGAEEIVYRRIGRNELDAMEACRGVVEAQREYASEGRDGQPAGTYAAKLISDTGRRNGLYWPVGTGEAPSPAGPLLAKASAENYSISGQATPYHGYYYRMLAAQGPAAPGGAKSYLVDGGMVGGFGLIAYPAEYRVSGVMTFLVGEDGVIYQKDLGPKTAELARQIKEYNPDSSWAPAE
ncbi:MAG: DUF2950 domain-containing protein [Acidobacteria bacterium]|jgi:hypothetical protein|nr:DUF2950 domain-containing protein [Acidobacteriota bacterium]